MSERAERYLIPANNAQAITKSDSTTYSPSIRLLYVGGAGDVAIMTRDGDTVTIAGLAAGAVIDWVLIYKVMSTNTTATNIVGLA